jgi:CO/xanthine dehydrogenase Mo-binding subunit
MNAVTDALGLKEFDMPATPSRVWQALQLNRAAAE